MNPDTLYVGIDAGGTHSRLLGVRGSDPAAVRVQGDGPGTNARILGTDRTADVLAALVREACGDVSVRLVVTAGVAGAGRAADREGLQEALAVRLGSPEKDIEVVADADLALDAAFGPGGAGLIVIAGTGSIAYARDGDGGVHRAGGWGRLLGDEGSGYHLGLRGLQAVADALDGGPQTALRALAATTWDAPDQAALLSEVYDRGRAPASFAPLVLEAAWNGDDIARRLVREGARALALRAAWAVRQAGAVPPRFALVGGLTEHEGYRAELLGAIAGELPGWSEVRTDVSPVEAALGRALLRG